MVRDYLITADRVVIKIGSRVLLEENGRPNYRQLAHLVEQIAALHKKNRQIIFVTSGAIGAGMEALGIKKRPTDLPTLQAAAAIGQVRLMRTYEDLFGEFGCMVAQVLLTRDDVNDRARHLSIKNTFNALLDRGVIPIVNENDTVAVEEIKFGDNDVLASLVAMMLEAKALVLLTTVEGFMITKENGEQERVGHIYRIDEEILRHIEAHKIGLSSGGMKSKLVAAANMIHVGGVAVVASGNATNALSQIFAGENIGTTVGLHHEKTSAQMPGKKRWIAFYQRAKGHLAVDDGAKLAITKQGKSLLAVGIYEVSGKFQAGDVVEIRDKNGVCFAKGVSQLDSTETSLALGQKVKEVIHRDNMVILLGENFVNNIEKIVLEIGQQAKKASYLLATLTSEKKIAALLSIAKALDDERSYIKSENLLDIKNAQEEALKPALIERLMLNDKTIDSMIASVLAIAKLGDPVGKLITSKVLDNQMVLEKVRVPLGVIGIIFESRPNVVSDVAALCLMSGNAVILRGGKEAQHSNSAIMRAIEIGLRKVNFIPFAVQMIPVQHREAVNYLCQLEQYVDVIIPRGGEGLIRSVSECSRVPVIKHYKGVCHIYVDEHADQKMAIDICHNAKCQRPSVCNAVEKILISEKIAAEFLPKLYEKLHQANVTMLGCERSLAIIKDMGKAEESDWTKEYLDLKVAIKIVSGVGEAIGHINAHGSHHSDAIISGDKAAQNRFVKEIDSAAVYVNASTRFTDGFVFGLGAEMGISTDKLHARGPMGLVELTTYKWVGYGDGQIRT